MPADIATLIYIRLIPEGEQIGKCQRKNTVWSNLLDIATKCSRSNRNHISVLKTGKFVTKVCDEVNRWAINLPFELLFR